MGNEGGKQFPGPKGIALMGGSGGEGEKKRCGQRLRDRECGLGIAIRQRVS